MIVVDDLQLYTDSTQVLTQDSDGSTGIGMMQHVRVYGRLSIMASQLKVDTLTGVTTAGSIVVTGEGNSTTTNLQQGLAKVGIIMKCRNIAIKIALILVCYRQWYWRCIYLHK